MIERFQDYASNERTFLSWIRTAVAIAGFGFVVEKLPGNLAPLSNTGAALLILSAALVLLSALRFLIIRRQISRDSISSSAFAALEVIFVMLLAVLLGSIGVFLFHLR